MASSPHGPGYVEGVATAVEARRTGHGSRAMRAANDVIRQHAALGALATGEHDFYARLGWERWRGPAWVIRGAGRERSEEDEAALMVLRFGTSATLTLTDPIACHERPGDDW